MRLETKSHTRARTRIPVGEKRTRPSSRLRGCGGGVLRVGFRDDSRPRPVRANDTNDAGGTLPGRADISTRHSARSLFSLFVCLSGNIRETRSEFVTTARDSNGIKKTVPNNPLFHP